MGLLGFPIALLGFPMSLFGFSNGFAGLFPIGLLGFPMDLFGSTQCSFLLNVAEIDENEINF